MATKHKYETLSNEERLQIIETRLDTLDNDTTGLRGLEVQLQQAEADAAAGATGADERAKQLKENIAEHRSARDERRAKVQALIDEIKAGK